jgi:hypothetical protein
MSGDEAKFLCEIQITLSPIAILKKSEQKIYSLMRMESPHELREQYVFSRKAEEDESTALACQSQSSDGAPQAAADSSEATSVSGRNGPDLVHSYLEVALSVELANEDKPIYRAKKAAFGADHEPSDRAKTGDNSLVLPADAFSRLRGGLVDNTPKSWRPDDTVAYSQTEPASKPAQGFFAFDCCSCSNTKPRPDEQLSPRWRPVAPAGPRRRATTL